MNKNADRSRRRRWLMLAAPFLIMAILAGTWCWYFRPHNPFPTASQIEAMSYGGFGDDHWPIPKNLWEDVLSALSPARRDLRPAKWALFGSLGIQTKRGNRIGVDLFLTDTPPGAFQIDSTYYRGGDSQALTKAILSAKPKGREHDREPKSPPSK
jgi:hypothetical protein